MISIFTSNKPQGPEYTVRMLLSKTIAEHKEVPELKKFSHFTLGCTSADKTLEVNSALEKLSDFFKDSVSFSAKAVVNLGDEKQPLWAVSLDLGKDEDAIRTIFSAQFDSIMCPEKNGILYLWQPKEVSEKVSIKCPHITIGASIKDKEIAEELVKLQCKFLFDRIDYKRVGPHDPLTSKALKQTCEKVLSPTLK